MDKWIIHALLVATFMVFAGTAAAQSAPGEATVEERAAAARKMLQEGRDEIIAEEMELSAAESGRFWPVYEAYREDMQVVRERYAALLGRYLSLYETGDITDEYARELLDGWLQYEQGTYRIRKDFVGKFEKVLPIRKVVRFYQLEDSMDAEIGAELAVRIPLMEPL
jgi:hypothetical protein